MKKIILSYFSATVLWCVTDFLYSCKHKLFQRCYISLSFVPLPEVFKRSFGKLVHFIGSGT